MARNKSLPAHLQGKDSRGDDHLTLYERHKKNPSPIDQGLAFQTHVLQMILLGPFYVRTRRCYGPPRIVSPQYIYLYIVKIGIILQLYNRIVYSF